MDYKEKYEQALERMKSWVKGEHPECFSEAQKAAEFIFPELKESEDEKNEKVRVDLIKAFNTIGKLKWGGLNVQDVLTWLERQGEPEDKGEISDGYHTFNELYRYRMLYNAAFFNLLPKELVHKSKRHQDGEECFGGGWFIVMANLPTGQISNHYELKDWDLFQIPERDVADEWDGHTPQEAADRLHKYLLEEQGEKKKLGGNRPWFKVGDWIIATGEVVYQIRVIQDTNVTLVEANGDESTFDISVLDDAKLWTIQDAKDGDVLVHNGCPFIFMGIKDGIVQALEENLLEGTNPVNFGEPKIDKDYQPATKEQRDTLFAKMADAGYKWNSEKKELRKVETKTLDADDILPYLGNNQVQDILEDMGMLDDNGRCPHTAEEIFKAGMEHAFNLNREAASSVKVK